MRVLCFIMTIYAQKHHIIFVCSSACARLNFIQQIFNIHQRNLYNLQLHLGAVCSNQQGSLVGNENVLQTRYVGL